MTAELELRSSPRILAGTRADIQLSCYRDGKLTNPTGTLTYSVANADGTVVASGAPTASGGIVTFVLTAAQNALPDQLTITWGGIVFDGEPVLSAVTNVESIGAWLFTLDDARARADGALGNRTKYPDAVLLEARDRIADEFDDILGFHVGSRYTREVHDGDGSDTLWLRKIRCTTLRSAAIRTYGTGSTWTALTSDELALCFIGTAGKLYREGGYWATGIQNVRVGYESGEQPIGAELKNAALALLQWNLTNNDAMSRATSTTNEMGTFALATPGVRGSYVGIPEIDEVLNRRKRKMPGIA